MVNIQSNNYYRLLNFSWDFFDSEKIEKTLWGSFIGCKNKHWTGMQHYFDKKFHSTFQKFNYDLINAELFYTPPFGKLLWHIDMYPPEDFIKINFVWGSDNHIMEWGELKNNSPMITSKTEVDSQYVSLTENDIISMKKIKIEKCALVNVGRPHRIINYSARPRWCLCAILSYKSKRIIFDQAISDLSEYVVD